MIEILKAPIDVDHVLRNVEDPTAGAISVFIGTARCHSKGKSVRYLEYQAYDPMALKMLRQIVDEAKTQWDIAKIAVVHRLGRIEIGEASVVIAVSASHRKEAFEACRYLIDTLKTDVPIWKKEFFEDGEMWVE